MLNVTKQTVTRSSFQVQHYKYHMFFSLTTVELHITRTEMLLARNDALVSRLDALVYTAPDHALKQARVHIQCVKVVYSH